MRGYNASTVRPTFGQWKMGVDYPSKRMQEFKMQMGIPYLEGCSAPIC